MTKIWHPRGVSVKGPHLQEVCGEKIASQRLEVGVSAMAHLQWLCGDNKNMTSYLLKEVSVKGHRYIW